MHNNFGRDPDGMTVRQRLFAEHYMSGLTPRQAAEAAGYAPSTAVKYGRQLLRTPRVVEFIFAQQGQDIEDVAAKRERIIKRLESIAFGDKRQLVKVADGRVYITPTDEYGDDAVALFDGAQMKKDGIEIKTKDQMRALEMLLRIYGLDNNQLKVEVEGFEGLQRAMGIDLPELDDGSDSE